MLTYYEESNEQFHIPEEYLPKRNINIYEVLGNYLKVSQIYKLDNLTTEIKEKMRTNTKEYKIKINKQD